MSGKVWILIIAYITHVYHVQSKCMDQDIRLHLDELLLKEHMFQIKVFSPETKENELLSVINTLCAYWKNNEDKKIQVVKTFAIMLRDLHKQSEDFCADLKCTDAYTVRTIDTATFSEMYRKSCNGSVSDLKCPSKSTPLTTISPTPEFSTTFLTTVNVVTTDHETTFSNHIGITSLTTVVSPNITAPENLTADPARTETIIKDGNQWATHGLLLVSFLLNIVLFFTVCHMYRKSKRQRELPLELQVNE